jgi:hypothetical protein
MFPVQACLGIASKRPSILRELFFGYAAGIATFIPVVGRVAVFAK